MLMNEQGLKERCTYWVAFSKYLNNSTMKCRQYCVNDAKLFAYICISASIDLILLYTLMVFLFSAFRVKSSKKSDFRVRKVSFELEK